MVDSSLLGVCPFLGPTLTISSLAHLMDDSSLLGVCPLLGPTLTQTGRHHHFLFPLWEGGSHLNKDHL